MKTILIGRPTIERCGIMHLLEHTAGCVVVSTCATWKEAREHTLWPKARLFCVEARKDTLSNSAMAELMQLHTRCSLVVYGSKDGISRKTRLLLISMGIKDVLDVGDSVEQMQEKIIRCLEIQMKYSHHSLGDGASYACERKRIDAILTRREMEVLKLVSMGETSKSIAYELNIAQNTVEFYRKRLMKKTGAGSIAGLTRIALRSGLTFLWE